MSPAPTARARPSPSCARCWRPPACACTSTPRRIWCGSTSASASAERRRQAGRAMPSCAAVLEECERVNAGEPITFSRSTTAAAFLLFARASGRRAAARSRPRRPARRHQRHRQAARDASSRRSRIDHMEFLGDTLDADRRREGRHHQARRAGDLRRAGAGGAGGDRGAGRRACARRCMRPGSTGMSASSAGGWSIRTSAACSICRRRSCSAGISSTMPALAIATLRAIEAFKIGMPAFEAGIVNAEWPARMQRLARARWSIRRRRACELWLDGGHNADGGRVAARRSAISRSACRARWC